MEKFKYGEITGEILESFYQVYNQIGFGFEQSIYINSIQIALKRHGLNSEIESQIPIYFDRQVVGKLKVDILVDHKIIIKITNNPQLQARDQQILHNQLKAGLIEVGLLLNFGDKPEHKRKIATID